MTSSGPREHMDAHQLLKSRWYGNEENHNGKSRSEHPLAVMAPPEGHVHRDMEVEGVEVG